MRRAALLGGLCLAALPAAAQERPAACDALLAAHEAGDIPPEMDPEALAPVVANAGRDTECQEWVEALEAAPAPFDTGPPHGLCEQLVSVALARVLVPEWQREYEEITASVAAGDEAECTDFFAEYGREVLDGRGPVCTRAGLMARAGLTQSYAMVTEAAEAGDEAHCDLVLEANLGDAAPPDPERAPGELRVGVCETIVAAVEAQAFRPAWQTGGDELLSLALQGDQDECWEVLEEYARETPDRRQGPWCSRAELAAASGYTRAPQMLAEAADSGNESLCRETVEAHPAVN